MCCNDLSPFLWLLKLVPDFGDGKSPSRWLTHYRKPRLESGLVPWTNICAWGPALSLAPCSTLLSSFFPFLQLSSSCWTLVPFVSCPSPLLTCSPTRYLASRPWWMAPSVSTGLRSLVGPSAGDNHTTAMDEEAIAEPVPGATQGWRMAGQPRGPKRLGGGRGTGWE